MLPRKFRSIVLLSSALISYSIAGDMKGQNSLVEGEESYRFYIKISAEQRVDVEDGELISYNRSRSSDGILQRLQEFSFDQLVNLDSEERTSVQTGRAVRASSEDIDLSSLSGLVELEGAADMSPEELLALAEELEQFESVEYCELVPMTPIAPPSMRSRATLTDNWVDEQFYLHGVDSTNSEVSGIYADYAWGRGIYGQGVTIADIEWGWDYEHEDFAGQNVVDALTTTQHTFDTHGTAVMGVMYAAENDFGVTGAVHGADAFMGFSEITNGRVPAILQAIDSLEAGDVLLYEMQEDGGDVNGNDNYYVPAD